jgi:glutaconyl-CoA/methylmalonyl-CoA decarboxylase subunit gamma
MIKHLRVTVNGKTYDVTVEELGQSVTAPAAVDVPVMAAAAAPAVAAAAAAPAPVAPASPASSGANDRTAPLGGIVVEILVAVGDSVVVDQPVVLLEAMKMRTVIGAHKAGRITAIYISVGNGVDVDQPLLSID